MRSKEGRRAARGVVALAICVCGASTLTGCPYSDPCWEVEACEPDPVPPPGPCEGEPGTAPALDECGVFVSPLSGDDRSPGTKDAPVKTLQHAIGLAAHGRGRGEDATLRVYACGGEFAETITLPSGVDLWGGRLCDGGDWSYEGSFGGPDHPTIIAPPGGIPLRVLREEGKAVAGDNATSVIAGVRVVAADASAPDGKSSIAVILSTGARAIVQDSVIVAGNGKDGEPGEDADTERAPDGMAGNHGVDACTTDAAVGALPVVTVCGDGIESTGGYGGDGGLDVGGDGAPGQPALAEDPKLDSHAGLGADQRRCEDGGDGANGADGGRADGALGPGFLSDDGWTGVRGGDGKKGGVGHGGGGGGGSKSRGPMFACPVGLPQSGAAGGSGGSGGCGGKGGGGGGYGGASIGIVALEGTDLTVANTDVFTGDGGRGGVGGTGQPGGVGRSAGNGGRGYAGEGMWHACEGGDGGNGGRGGDAGGGLGGASVGIAYVVPNFAIRPGTTVSVGGAGDGGFAGNAGTEDEVGKGESGPRGQLVAFPAASEPLH
ncbi:hypothetical protein sce6131 [Sorangium cellulosum So ce56]|uniref:PGRS family protein n=1 Tax=Sorangium cellulosum (strain So ce56) TaxID=448385 RepID=A9GG96_SORC5|nr:hypothetical protein [Sorangium cellulosum]CAN96297.1 hypothetical protein sce6131 [Sorangium cellulosum So ce56]